MKLLYVVHQFLPKSVAGTEVYTDRLIREMQRDHEVHLLYGDLEPEQPQYDVHEGDYQGIPFTRMIYNYRVGSFEETYRNAAAEEVFLEVLDRFRPDLVHIQHLQAWSVGLPLLARARGIPVVHTLHEYAGICPAGGQMILPDLVRCDGPGPQPCGACIRTQPLMSPDEAGVPADEVPAFEATRRAEAYLEMADSVSLFISPSRFLRERFIASGYPADRLIATDNGFDVTPFDGYRREESRGADGGRVIRFAYVGAMVPYKGVHVLVDAFNEMTEEGWQLHIHGGVRPESPHYPYQEEIRARATDPRIRVHGAFRPDEVAEVYRDVDVLIVPSVWVENSPLTIHEAFVVGAPVITSNLGGMAELIQHGKNGLLFEPGDPAALRDAARRILEEPELLSTLRAGIPHVKTMPEHAVEMNEIYAGIAARPLVGEGRAHADRLLESLPDRARLARERARALEEAARPQPPAEEATPETAGESAPATVNTQLAPARRSWWKRLFGRI